MMYLMCTLALLFGVTVTNAMKNGVTTKTNVEKKFPEGTVSRPALFANVKCRGNITDERFVQHLQAAIQYLGDRYDTDVNGDHVNEAITATLKSKVPEDEIVLVKNGLVQRFAAIRTEMIKFPGGKVPHDALFQDVPFSRRRFAFHEVSNEKAQSLLGVVQKALSDSSDNNVSGSQVMQLFSELAKKGEFRHEEILLMLVKEALSKRFIDLLPEVDFPPGNVKCKALFTGWECDDATWDRVQQYRVPVSKYLYPMVSASGIEINKAIEEKVTPDDIPLIKKVLIKRFMKLLAGFP